MRLALWLWGGNLHRPGPEFRPSLPLDSWDSIPLVPNRWNLFPSTWRSGAQRMSVHLGGTPEVHHGAPCVSWLTVRMSAKPAAQKRRRSTLAPRIPNLRTPDQKTGVLQQPLASWLTKNAVRPTLRIAPE